MERIVKIGIIGCGGIANGKHMPSLKALPNVQMIAFCDIVKERAEKAAAKYGTPDAKIYTDYKELLANPEVEVVHVLTPNREHAEMTINALYAGKHVMCEKPMAKTAADAKRMVEAAKATGKKLTIGYQGRQSVGAEYAKAYVEEGHLGKIYHANCYAVRRRGTPNWGVFLDENAQGGGPVIDIATHSLDLTLYLMNNYEPAVVLGKTHRELENPAAGNIWGDKGVNDTKLEQSAAAMIVMKNGATILLETSWSLNTDTPIDAPSCRLCGSREGLSLLRGKVAINRVELGRAQDIQVDLSAGGVDFYAGADHSPAANEARNWIRCITEDTEPVVKPEQACVVSEILEAIYTSSKTGKAVYFD